MTARSARGADPIIDALDNPSPAPVMAAAGDAEMDTQGRRDKRVGDYAAFPPGCPVTPLGILSDMAGKQTCFYLDCNRQLVGMEANNKHGKLGLAAMFGPKITWLYDNWPKWSAPKKDKPSEVVGFDQAEAAEALVVECSRKGPFDPAGRMRGRGAHRTAEGNGLILHCGDKVLVSDLRVDGSIKRMRWVDPGLIERNVYSAGEAIPRPHHEDVGENVGMELLALLQTWHWRRPLLDARFALGAIGAGFVGGALPWRPNIWITGGRGTGKSTLNGQHGVIHQLNGEGLFRTGDASAAGIRQSLRNATVPVLFDEIEASENNSRVAEVIKLARVASSGDTMTRGGQDHTAHEFTLRSLFWFSSILVPPLEPQDLSRLALLELRPLRREVVEQGIDLARYNLPAMGRKLFRRMVDGWGRLAATKIKFHRALAETGHDSRACDQFGTLLACADLLINDWDTEDGLPSDEEVALWAHQCHPHKLAEVAQAVSEQEACANHLVTSMVQARGGEERESLSTWIAEAADLSVAGIDRQEKAQKRLEQMGLKIVHAVWKAGAGDMPGKWGAKLYSGGAPGFLAVSDSHQALKAIFAGTKWQGGVWKQSLIRFDGARAVAGVKMAHATQRVVLVPLWAVLDETGLPDGSGPDETTQWMLEQCKGGEE